uniref:Uncharacterized protein n=1 Tax=Tanacetum cinerariifolium TaxID=118510 RepID=A0A699HUC6_TANCI|nr:hypothetical protein [Tanacetum cinerariifolium]
MATSIISDSSEESVWTSKDELSCLTDQSKDSSSDHIPPLPATLSFLPLTDDSSGIDIPDTSPSPTHDHFASVDYSSSDHFASDNSSSSSSSKTSLDSATDALSNSASSRYSSDHSLPAPSSASPSCKRSRSPAAFVPLSSLIPRALSYACADLLPSPKRIKSSEFATNLEGCLVDRFEPSRHRETDLEMDVNIVRRDGIEIDPEIQAGIDECIAYVNALRDRGIDARVVVETVDRDEIETDARGPVKFRVDRVTHPVTTDDIPEPAQEEGAVEVTYKTLGDLVQRFHDHTVEIPVHLVQDIEGV